MIVIADRTENGFIVFQTESGVSFNVPAAVFPGVKEGDAFRFEAAPEQTALRRAASESKMKNIFKK